MNRTPADIEPFVQIALRLQTLILQKQYDLIPSLFTAISFKNGGKLSIRMADPRDPFCRESMLILTFPDGEMIEDKDRDFEKMLTVKNSFMGAWQVYLLNKLWMCLPLYGHAGYAKAKFFYTSDQLKEFARIGKDDFGHPIEGFDPHKYDVTPSIQFEDDTFIVKVHVWNDWRGLLLETKYIHIDSNGNVEIGKYDLDPLFEYNCDVNF